MDDETRFHGLFVETYHAVVRYAYNRGHRGAEAEDLVASTYEIAWRRLAAVPEGEWTVPWLLEVARNLSRNAVRKAQRERFFIEALNGSLETTGADPVEDGVVAREALLRGLLALKEIDRELILLVAWDGLEPAQAGEVLGLGAGATRSRLHRARHQLAALLGDSATSAAPSRATAPPRPDPHTTQQEKQG